jgi:hypothetical protein
MTSNTMGFRSSVHRGTSVGAGARRRRGSRHRLQPALLELEERRLLAIAVTSTADGVNVAGTLRSAINAANEASSPTSIVFELGTSAATITLTQGVLELTNTRASVTIYDGPGQGDVTVSGNNNGRVFKIDKGVTANISDLVITKGLASGFSTSSGSGGALYNQGTVNLMDCTITGNVAEYQGGGLYNIGTANLTDCDVSYNNATDGGSGGGIFDGSEYISGTLSMTDCTVGNNKAAKYGGGLYDRFGIATLENCTITNNSAYSGGGAFSQYDIRLTGCTISGNMAVEDGGGVYSAASVSLSSCTLYNNQAGNAGGGLANDDAATLTACTVSGNSAYRSGGLANHIGLSALVLTDTIVAGNTFTSSPHAPSDIGGFLFPVSNVTGSSNLIGTGGSGGLSSASNQLNVPIALVGLAPLGYYGGPTQTIALKAASKAIRAGVYAGLTTDQRGFKLDSPKPDIGAFQSGPLVVNTTSDNPSSPPGILSLRQAVSLANVADANATITFDPRTFAQAQTITLTADALGLQDSSGVEAITTAGLAAGVTIKASNRSRVFVVGTNVVASISGLTITGGDYVRGGGLFNAGNLTLTDCTVTGNTSFYFSSTYPGNGGGLANYGNATLTDCTISGNTAAKYGGGVFNAGTLSLASCTISDNSSGAKGGGGLWNAQSPATLLDTIVAGNTDSSHAADDIQGRVSVSGCFNLTGTGGSGGLTASGFNLIGIANPGLAKLGSYGGPTQSIALLPGSPAIGSGGVINRGKPRPVSGLDIGAFQDRGFSITVTKGSSPQSATVNTAFAKPLSVIVFSPFGDPVAGGVITYTAPSSGPSAILQTLTATIDSNGRASVSAMANGTPGSYSVTAKASGVTTAAVFSLTNTPPAPTQLVIHTQPSPTATAGSPFSMQPVVYVEDKSGNLESGDNTTVVTVSSLPAGSGPLRGTTSVTVHGGIATFTNLADNTAETITLQFTSDPTLTPATSSSIVVGPNTAGHMSIHTQPSSTATAGLTFSTQPLVYVEDQFGNLVTGDFTTQVTAALDTGTGPLRGTTTITVSGGVARFTQLYSTTAETISLVFTSVPAISNKIVVSPAQPYQLVIQTQPAPTAKVGVPFSTQPVIYVEDQYGNLETGDSSTLVTASLRVGIGPLSGTTSVVVSGGIATFTNLSDDTPERIILVFTSPRLAKAQSNPVQVNPITASTRSVTANISVMAIGSFAVKRKTLTIFGPRRAPFSDAG